MNITENYTRCARRDFIYSLHSSERSCLLKELHRFESIAIAQGKGDPRGRSGGPGALLSPARPSAWAPGRRSPRLPGLAPGTSEEGELSAS